MITNVTIIIVKKFVLAMFVAFAFFAFEMTVPKSSEAYYHAPWYACYVESGGTLQKCVGPFDNKYACMGYQYSIPYGARWMGCKQ